MISVFGRVPCWGYLSSNAKGKSANSLRTITDDCNNQCPQQGNRESFELICLVCLLLRYPFHLGLEESPLFCWGGIPATLTHTLCLLAIYLRRRLEGNATRGPTFENRKGFAAPEVSSAKNAPFTSKAFFYFIFFLIFVIRWKKHLPATERFNPRKPTDI